MFDKEAGEESTDYQVESLVGPCPALIFSYATILNLFNGRSKHLGVNTVVGVRKEFCTALIVITKICRSLIKKSSALK